MLLRDLAHARTGDKGTLVMISLIARRPEDYPLLEREITADRVTRHFAGLAAAPVARYALPQLSALNFVLRRPDSQSVTRSLALDAHGKCLASALLALEIEIEEQPRP